MITATRDRTATDSAKLSYSLAHTNTLKGRISMPANTHTHKSARTTATVASMSTSGAECQQESNFLALISTELNVSEEMTNRQLCSKQRPIKTNSSA